MINFKTITEALSYIDNVQKTVNAYTNGSQEILLKDKERVKKSLALILLISCTIIQLLNLEDVGETINELKICSKDLLEKYVDSEVEEPMNKKKKLNSSKSKKVNEGPTPHNVLIDIIISLMTRCSCKLKILNLC